MRPVARAGGGALTALLGLLQEDLENGEDVATCPSCSLILRVIYDQVGAEGGQADAVPARPSECRFAALCGKRGAAFKNPCFGTTFAAWSLLFPVSSCRVSA